jgi:hypothetical protein
MQLLFWSFLHQDRLKIQILILNFIVRRPFVEAVLDLAVSINRFVGAARSRTARQIRSFLET